VAREALGLPGNRPIVLWVGRMVPVKGLDVLLEAWAAVLRTIPTALLVLVGEGDERAALERRAASLGDSVRFAGARPHAELADWYRAADLLVLPSRSEGVPNVLLEALACGTPFVASDVGSVASLATPECEVVPAESPRALAGAIARALPAAPMTRRTTADTPDRRAATAEFREAVQAVIARGASRASVGA
jgi:glycosyltransferase involved in cell wall biosynthesis